MNLNKLISMFVLESCSIHDAQYDLRVPGESV